MKRILLLAAIVMVLAPAAWAQVPVVPSFQVGVGGGLNMPLGTIGDGMNNGYNFNASLGYSVVPMFVIGAEIGLWGNGANDETIATLGQGGDMSMKNWQFTAMTKYKVPMAMHNVYAKGLAGMYRTSSEVTSGTPAVTLDVADTNFGFGIGGGFELGGMANAAFYAEGMYHQISGETEDGKFATFNVGVLFSLP
jgi:opacity protein-like surface antigen